MVDDLRSITVQDINALAKTYLLPNKAINVRIVPEDSTPESAPAPVLAPDSDDDSVPAAK